MEANELHAIRFRAEAASHLYPCCDPNCPKMPEMVERIAGQPVAPEVTSRKRTIPFVYRPRIKKHQRRKTVINCLQPYPADTLANITLKRVLVTPCEDQIISLGFVSKQGTLTITVDRSVVQQLGEALIKAVEPSYVGAGIET